MDILQYILAFIVTLGILVTFHELGHFLIARLSGVMVTRFSVGFGRPLLSHRDRHGTEFVLAALPLGGYVRMLDEREGDVAPEEAERSYNRLTPAWRIAIALGGPAANFVLAAVAYWILFVAGTTAIVPIMGVAPDSPAAAAGATRGDQIVAVDGDRTPSWPDVAMALASRLGDSGRIVLTTARPGSESRSLVEVPIEAWHSGEDEPNLLGSLGIEPYVPAMVGEVVPGGAAARAGLERFDRVLAVNGEPIEDWQAWVEVVQASPETPLEVTLERDGAERTLTLTPESHTSADGSAYGFVGVAALTDQVVYGPIAAVGRAVAETWEKTVLTLDLLKKMVTGLVSTTNLSGPITIAQVAGESAESGWRSFTSLLALLSISLGVLNLLPVPILDGGHVVFCLAEMVKGKPLSERVQAAAVQVGLFIVGGLMLLAFYNDIARLF